MTDLPGLAIKDFYDKKTPSKLYVHDEFGPRVEMPINVYFRDLEKMPTLEQLAIKHCEGRILEIGAGAGSHALELQMNGYDVTALEISPASCETMVHRGIKKVVCEDIFNYQADPFDTLLLLMNGIGLCGTIEGLNVFLDHAATLLTDKGSLIFDSSDIAYMYEDASFPEQYYGEMRCRYEYQKQMTDWFHWLYIDAETLTEIAEAKGWSVTILYEDDHYQYLAKLTK